MNRPRTAALALAALATAGCVSMDLFQVWRDPNYQPAPVHRVFVVALTPEPQDRPTFENAIAHAIQLRGFEVATAAANLAPGPVDDAKVAAYAKDNHVDLVIVQHLTSLAVAQPDIAPADASGETIVYKAMSYPKEPIWNGAMGAHNFVTFPEVAASLATSLVNHLLKAQILVR